MSLTCLLTDNTAQFTKLTYPGRELVHVIPLHTRLLGSAKEQEGEIKVSTLPASARNGLHPQLAAPSPEEFRQTFLMLGQSYNEVVAILHSAYLSSTVANAREAAESVRGRVSVQVIDSQTVSVGLGNLVQSAAEAAGNDAPSTEIERLMRSLIPHVYSIFCIPGLTYLYHSGFIGKAQALVGEMLGVLPIFTLEDGHLTPLEKVRNPRHLMDFLQEFLDEFTDLQQIAVIQSVPPMVNETKMLREHALENFPKTSFNEYQINLPVAFLFGPHSIGVFVIEKPGL